MAELKHAINLERKISKTASMVDDAHFFHDNGELARPYVGLSIIGHPCKRYLWLNFRWFSHEIHEGRLLRLFRRGQREEETVVEDLKLINFELANVLEDQANLDFGCHVKGHPDGVILSGVPEAPKTMHALEIKTHNKENFEKLVKDGVKKSKPMHYAQMQGEMLGLEVDRALYVAVCKDDDRMYTERVDLDKEFAEKLIQKGKEIALSDDIPSGISTRADWYECKMCRFHEFCFGSELPEINCRTCAHFTAKEDSTCYCECYEKTIPLDVQYRSDCPCHVIHPCMVKWELDNVHSTKDSAMYIIDGESVLNGWEGRSSAEIIKAIRRKDDPVKGISEEGSSVDF